MQWKNSLLVFVCLLVPVVAWGEEPTEKPPSVLENSMAAFFLEIDSDGADLLTGISIPIMEKGPLCLDFGLIGSEDDLNYLLNASLDLEKFCELIDADYMLPDRVRVGFYGGYDFEDQEWLKGVYVGIKFR